MPRPLNVLFVASEVEPFAKTGGLADVAGALPPALAELGNHLRVVLPRYASITEKKFALSDVPQLKDLEVPVDGIIERAAVKASSLPAKNTHLEVYMLEHSRYFGREGLYVDSTTKRDYPDNDERFTFFCRGTLELIRRLGWKPDIIHCNDWQSGLILAYLKTIYKVDEILRDAKSVFTVHNMAYQGRFPKDSFTLTGLPPSVFSPNGIELFGQVNFLKAGLVYADAITTVSEKYAEEICSSPEFGFELEGLLRSRRNVLHGIINGIDYNIWSPEIDPLIPANYSVKDLSGKKINKRALQEQFRLEPSEETPVLGIISRLADQKGFDLVSAIAPELLKLDLQLVVLGTGEPKYHKLFDSIHKQYPRKVGVFLGFSNELAHLIEAGSDIFLMPSRYEPCGLNQMYSLKYGTVPVVRATGGLDDTIQDFNPSTRLGTGFKFVPYNAEEFLTTIRRALQVYQDKEKWNALMVNGMTKDFSWAASAKKYDNLYHTLIGQ